MPKLSRLEQTFFRLQAQYVCLNWAFEAIRDRPGPVAELGLGHGRTFDHLRHHLPEREIFVFDRENDAYADCQPDPAYFILGDVEDTLPAMYGQLGGRIVLANSDLGSRDLARDRALYEKTSRLLPPLIAPGGIVMSDRPMMLDGFETLPLPNGAPRGPYQLYRKPG